MLKTTKKRLRLVLWILWTCELSFLCKKPLYVWLFVVQWPWTLNFRHRQLLIHYTITAYLNFLSLSVLELQAILQEFGADFYLLTVSVTRARNVLTLNFYPTFYSWFPTRPDGTDGRTTTCEQTHTVIFSVFSDTFQHRREDVLLVIVAAVRTRMTPANITLCNYFLYR